MAQFSMGGGVALGGRRGARDVPFPSPSSSSSPSLPRMRRTKGGTLEWRPGALKDLKQVRAHEGSCGNQGLRLVRVLQEPAAAEALQRSQSDGSLKVLRATVHRFTNAGGGKEPELLKARAQLEKAEQCARECRDGLMQAQFEAATHADCSSSRAALRRAVRTASSLDLGPRLWEDPHLGEAREHLRAQLRLEKAQCQMRRGAAFERAGQEERVTELKRWMKAKGVEAGCGTSNFGPGAHPRVCKECKSRHFWFCHGCCCVQYAPVCGESCMHGCDQEEYGWTCITSTCGGATDCGCSIGFSGWRMHGSIRLPYEDPPEVPPPIDDNMHLENYTLRELLDLCKKEGEYKWRRMLPPCPQIQRNLETRCKEYSVDKSGNYMCLISRLNWAAMKRGEEDMLSSGPPMDWNPLESL
eukprot:TRINITY_DN24543_c0_g1_i1.p1 TRINITY_DN24543_c0_g1~~TRINITY_DN24543_c0_g1_i1.p1  ORF type:complete len:428 (-),score=71.89 TRINITY_DN24543_c0_g1_i1:30-1268(-)